MHQTTSPGTRNPPFSSWSRRFWLNLAVMAVCFSLYYLGLFGRVEGPLNPGRIGESLARSGATRDTLIWGAVIFLGLAVTWNWIFNLACYGLGFRTTCRQRFGDREEPCGAAAKRRRETLPKTARVSGQYVCSEGHRQPEAHFHPLKKGVFGNALWVFALLLCGMLLYLG